MHYLGDKDVVNGFQNIVTRALNCLEWYCVWHRLEKWLAHLNVVPA